MDRAVDGLGVISVVFENRSDGGLRVYSDDVPGFILSHPDSSAVMRDVEPALETIVGEMLGYPVKVLLSTRSPRRTLFDDTRLTREYETRRAA